jgi:competence protein ComEA
VRLLDPFTPAERRLALLLFVLAALGTAVHGSRRLSPEVEAWLERGPSPPAAPAGKAPADSVPAGPTAAAGRLEDPAAAPPAGGTGAAAPPSGKVDPNSAGPGRLMTLPGIGPALAGRIVADREAHGPYRRPEDLLRVPGIGPATLARLRPELSLP